MPESAYLKGPCLCTDGRDCWHGRCVVRRQLRTTGKFLLQNPAGCLRLVGTGEITVKVRLTR